MKKLTAIVIGAGHRGTRYADIMAQCPEKFQVIGVAESIKARREALVQKHSISDENIYESWEQILDRKKFADVAIIATMDRMHLEPALKAMELGYDLLLEKPVTPTPEECIAIYKKANECKTKVLVCHVLRYTPFFKKIKECIDSGMVGDVISIEHTEAVGNAHQSHSFVRGNWSNSDESSFMLLQKSCHDLDILQWLIGKKCKRIQSFGSLTYFKKSNAPKGSPEYCIEGCPSADSCPYNVLKLYFDNEEYDWFKRHLADKVEPSDDEILNALKTTQYGKCVYKCNNNVVDHQTVNMEFEDDVTVVFTMCAFTKGGRKIHIMGTKGELTASMNDSSFEIFDFLTRETKEIPISAKVSGDSIMSGHGGGDDGIVDALYDYLTGVIGAEDVSEIGVSAQNHMLAFAAEKSRLDGKVIDMEAFCSQYYNN